MNPAVPQTHTTSLVAVPSETGASSSGSVALDVSELGGLFQHVSRPTWGLATRVAAGDAHSSYQFEDGKLRKIGHAYTHLLAMVDRPRDESERLQRDLAARAGLSLARRGQRDSGQPLITLDEQVRLFLGDFDGGFEDATYVSKHRGGGRTRAKRHRDAAIAQAQELLGRKELLQLMSTYRHDVVIERVGELLAATSLVTKRQLEVLKALDERGVRRAATALCDLLYGDVHGPSAMQAWIDALASAGKGVSWPLATAVPALVLPRTHMCLLDSVIGHQARWMAPSVRMNRTPSGKLYIRLQEMALGMIAELEARDLKPRDLLDVFDFVWLTLRPAARKRIAVMPAVPVKSQTSLKDVELVAEPELSPEPVLESSSETMAA